MTQQEILDYIGLPTTKSNLLKKITELRKQDIWVSPSRIFDVYKDDDIVDEYMIRMMTD